MIKTSNQIVDTRVITYKDQKRKLKDLQRMGLTPIPLLKPDEQLSIGGVTYWRRGRLVLNIHDTETKKTLFQYPFYNMRKQLKAEEFTQIAQAPRSILDTTGDLK